MQVSAYFKPAFKETMAQTNNQLRVAAIIGAAFASVFIVTLPFTIPGIVVAFKRIRADYKQKVANHEQRALHTRKIAEVPTPSLIRVPDGCDVKKFRAAFHQVLTQNNFLLREDGEICTSHNQVLGESAKDHVYRTAKQAYDHQEAAERQAAISAAEKQVLVQKQSKIPSVVIRPAPEVIPKFEIPADRDPKIYRDCFTKVLKEQFQHTHFVRDPVTGKRVEEVRTFNIKENADGILVEEDTSQPIVPAFHELLLKKVDYLYTEELVKKPAFIHHV